jgi:hypothetical protein
MAIDWLQWWDRLPYVGVKAEEIAPRTIPLKLSVPVLRASKRRDQKKLQPPPDRWKELNKYPTELLREIDRYLQRVNIERISEKNRHAWTEHALQYACPAMRKIYSEHYKSDALPETHDRREGLVAAINVCIQLGAVYKRQLNLDFALSDARYSRVRTRVCSYALRVLELIRMEQRLRAMRYQKLSTKSWQDCNQIFFAISQCENIDEPQPGLNCLQVLLDSQANEVDRRAPIVSSLNLVYLSIQLNGLFDINAISCHKLHVVDAQIARVIDTITIIPDHGKELGRGKLLIYYGQEGPPYFRRQDEKQRRKQIAWLKAHGESVEGEILSAEYKLRDVIIDIAPLDALLMEEHQRMLELFESSDSQTGSPAKKESRTKNKYTSVADQDDLANLLTIDVMCDNLQLKRRKEEREYILGQKVLYMYSGFMSVYKLLVDASVEEDEESAELEADSELRDALAGRSALIASDLEANEFGKWFVVDKSEGGVHIKTRETEFTTALFIGQVVAFAYTREELAKPMVGYVIRLRRGVNKEIEVTIRILSRLVTATAVQSEFLSQNDMALPAIVLNDDGRHLMVHQSHRLSPGTAVQLELEQHGSDVISELLRIQREFVVYSLEG